jgi:Na+-transporting methylmalonyl-CoA/oxaloacetate decarboxylase gamma subunit
VTVIQQGLLISLLGLMLTFLALGMLILTIVILQRLFNPLPALPSMPGSVAGAPSDVDEEAVAAIAAAVLVLRTRDRRSSTLGRALEAGPGRWWQGPQTSDAPPTRKYANGRNR